MFIENILKFLNVYFKFKFHKLLYLDKSVNNFIDYYKEICFIKYGKVENIFNFKIGFGVYTIFEYINSSVIIGITGLI